MINSAVDTSYEDKEADQAAADLSFAAFLKYLVGLVRRSKILIAAITLSVVALGLVVTLLITPKYRASAQILIEDQADQIIEGTDLQQAVPGSETERFLQTQIGLINSRAVATSVVQAGKLANDAGFYDDMGGKIATEPGRPGQKLADARQEAAVNLLLENLAVTIPVDSRIAQITITSRSPSRSANLANLYAARFIDYNLNQKYDSSSYARKFLSQQLEDVRYKLTKSELELNQYARAAGLIRLGGQDKNGNDSALSVTNSQLQQLNSAAAAATAERIQAEDRWKTVSGLSPLSISEINTNSAIMQLLTAKAAAESQLADERTRHLPGYSSVKAKEAEVAELNRRINTIAGSIKNSIEVDYRAAREKERSLLDQVAQRSTEALNEQDRGVQYQVLKRDADTNRALYDSLLARYNQLNASSGASSNNITIVDQATAPQYPSSPNLPLNLALSFILGLVIAAAVVLIKDLLDDAIRSPEDVERKLGLPMLGLVPKSKTGDVKEDLKDRRSSVSEAYLSLVTNLTYATPGGLPRLMAITSAHEGEGKSSTSWAIANELALVGKNVLLVDYDLRRPTLHRTMHDTANSGLTDFLVGEKSFDEVLRRGPGEKSFSYITALPLPPDPGRLLAGGRLGEFLDQARSRFDVVILDCPPLLGLSDVPLVAERTDGILFVTDASNFRRGAVKSALRRVRLAKGNLLGVVLNRFTPTVGSENYEYYGYSYYSYGNSDS